MCDILDLKAANEFRQDLIEHFGKYVHLNIYLTPTEEVHLIFMDAGNEYHIKAPCIKLINDYVEMLIKGIETLNLPNRSGFIVEDKTIQKEFINENKGCYVIIDEKAWVKVVLWKADSYSVNYKVGDKVKYNPLTLNILGYE